MDTYRPEPSGDRERWSRERSGSWLGWAVFVVVALVAAAVIFLFLSSEPPQRVAIADLGNPASPMTGASVTVEGEVEESLSDQAVTVRDDVSDEPLLVIAHADTVVDGMAPLVMEVDPLAADPAAPADPLTQPLPALPTIPSSGPLRVIGTVETFDPAAVAETLGVTLDEGMAASFEGSPYVIADQIETSFDPSTIPPDEPADASAAD